MSKLFKFTIVVSVVLVSACAGLSYVMENYDGVEVQKHSYGGENWRVFHKPKEHRLMITPTVGKAALAGATFQFSDAVGGANKFKDAASAFVKAYDSRCKITRGAEVISLQYEYFYDCN